MLSGQSKQMRERICLSLRQFKARKRIARGTASLIKGIVTEILWSNFVERVWVLVAPACRILLLIYIVKS